jgi:hypothetical protein
MRPFVWLFSWVWEKSKTPLENQLRQLDRPQFWGAQVTPQVCRQCKTVNESRHHSCFQCGTSLPSSESDTYSNKSSGLTHGDVIVMVLAIIIVILLFSGALW